MQVKVCKSMKCLYYPEIFRMFPNYPRQYQSSPVGVCRTVTTQLARAVTPTSLSGSHHIIRGNSGLISMMSSKNSYNQQEK